MEWFRHDVFARNDIKLRKLARDHGLEGIGAFWIAVEILYAHGGSYPEQNLRDELDFFGRDLLDDLVSYDLMTIEDGTVRSHRVKGEIEYQEELRQKRAEAGRMGGLAKASNAKQMLSNAKQNPSNAKQSLAKSSTFTVTDTNNTESSSSKNDSQLIRNNSDSCKSADPHDAPAPKKGPEAGAPAKKTYITIINNRGEEVPIYQDLVDLWAKTYPAVDVKAELQRMKSWAISNPTQRKTSQGMTRFCDNWLKREQDRSGTRGSAPRHRDYSDVRPEDLDKEWSWNV